MSFCAFHYFWSRAYFFHRRQSEFDAPFVVGAAADKFIYDILKKANVHLGFSVCLTKKQMSVAQSARRRFIYGAGKRAIVLYDYLLEHHIDIDGFLVTNTAYDAEHIDGLPVYGVRDIHFNPEDLILISVLERNVKDVIQSIRLQGDCRFFVQSL